MRLVFTRRMSGAPGWAGLSSVGCARVTAVVVVIGVGGLPPLGAWISPEAAATGSRCSCGAVKPTGLISDESPGFVVIAGNIPPGLAALATAIPFVRSADAIVVLELDP